MVSVILSLVAAIPFVLLFLLLVVRRWGSLKAMTVVWVFYLESSAGFFGGFFSERAFSGG